MCCLCVNITDMPVCAVRVVLLSFCSGTALNLNLLLQILVYWSNTNRLASVGAAKKTDDTARSTATAATATATAGRASTSPSSKDTLKKRRN